MSYPVKIISTGVYIPNRVVSNNELEASVSNYDSEKGGGNLDQWIKKHYGIEERRWSDKLPSDQAVVACKMALNRAELDISEIDFLILNTAFGDTSQPTTATEIQKKLGMKSSSFAMEINSPCAGSVFGITTATHFINSGKYQKALVVGVDKMTGLIDMSDFKMAGLFGEGAGACLLSKSEESGILAAQLGSAGEDGNPDEYALRVLGGKALFPASSTNTTDGHFHLQMNGKLVEDFVHHAFADSVARVVEESKTPVSEIDHVVTHQAAESLILQGLEKCGVDSAKTVMTIKEYGNTSAASMLITLDKLFNSNLTVGEKVLLLGMGGGLNWGGILYQHVEK